MYKCPICKHTREVASWRLKAARCPEGFAMCPKCGRVMPINWFVSNKTKKKGS